VLMVLFLRKRHVESVSFETGSIPVAV
jgi:hypothetical protein